MLERYSEKIIYAKDNKRKCRGKDIYLINNLLNNLLNNL